MARCESVVAVRDRALGSRTLKKHFPADWHIGLTNSKGKLLPDTAAYKGYGNAVSTVCAEYPIANIVEILKEAQDADSRDN